MSAVNAELVDDIKKRAFDECIDLAQAMIASQMGVNDHALSRGQRIARFVERAQSGALDAMKGINPDLYRRTVRQYVDDIGNSPIGGA